MPNSDPLDEPIVATEVAPLTHEPPDVPLVSVIVCPTQAEAGPPMVVGAAVTVTTRITKLPPAV